MASLTALAPITTLATALSNLILVTPNATQGYQPQNQPDANGNVSTANQPPSLLFHYEGEQTVSVTSDITDHYVEDNTAIQDQIALKPVIITTHGFIGELNNVPPAALAILQAAASKLTTISAYTPVLSATALLAYDEAFLLYQTAANATNSAVSAWSSLTGSGGENVLGSTGSGTTFNPINGKVAGNQNLQQTYFQQFYGYWVNRYLFTVQTPWAIFQNMAIQSLRAIQSEETRMITDFEVSFKLIRFAQSAATTTVQQNRAATQASLQQNNGTNAPPVSQNSSAVQAQKVATGGSPSPSG
jgi:hypothetical protein